MWWGLFFVWTKTGIEKKTWIPACPWDKYLSNFACSGQVLVWSFNDLVGRWVAWSLAHWANENEQFLA